MKTKEALDNTVNGFIVTAPVTPEKNGPRQNKMADNEEDNIDLEAEDKEKLPRMYFPIKVRLDYFNPHCSKHLPFKR